MPKIRKVYPGGKSGDMIALPPAKGAKKPTKASKIKIAPMEARREDPSKSSSVYMRQSYWDKMDRLCTQAGLTRGDLLERFLAAVEISDQGFLELDASRLRVYREDWR